MSDDLNKRRPQDSSRINILESWELTWWSNHFGVTKEKLIAAVNAVGNSSTAVKLHLGK